MRLRRKRWNFIPKKRRDDLRQKPFSRVNGESPGRGKRSEERQIKTRTDEKRKNDEVRNYLF